MSKTRVTICLTEDEFAFAGGHKYNNDNVRAYETAIEDALDAALASAGMAYETAVHITMGYQRRVADVSGLDRTDEQDEAAYDLINERLNDDEFTGDACQDSWATG